MKNKTIHISLGKANPNRMNGVNKVLHSLLSAQATSDNKVEYWGISFSNEHNYPKRPFKTRLFKDSKMKFKLDPELENNLKSLKDQKDVMVHLHGAFIPQIYKVAKILVKNNVPYVFTPHGGYNIEALNKSKLAKKVYLNMIERFVIQNAKSVHLIGESEITGLIKNASPRRYDVIPNGQESIKLNTEKRINQEVLHLGYLGRIDIKTKGLDILIKAVDIARSEIDIKLTIIGAGGESDQLNSMINELDLRDEVELAGAMFGDEKFMALSRLDTFCLVSRNEGLPGVVLEAAAVGVPSIVSKQTNMGQYIKEANAGWVIEEYNEASLAQTFVQVATNKMNEGLKDEGLNAKKMVENTFCWNKIAQKLAEIYAA